MIPYGVFLIIKNRYAMSSVWPKVLPNANDTFGASIVVGVVMRDIHRKHGIAYGMAPIIGQGARVGKGSRSMYLRVDDR